MSRDSYSSFEENFQANTKAIPVNTAKYLTKELVSVQRDIEEIKEVVNDNHFKDSTLLGNLETLQLKEKSISKSLEGQVVQIKDQNNICCLGNAIKILFNGKEKTIYLDHVPTKATGTISINSSLGRKIWGKKVGDTGTFLNENTKKPTEQKWEILKIYPHSEAKKMFFKKEEERGNSNLQTMNKLK